MTLNQLPEVTVCVFAKPPRAGTSKTRLASSIGGEAACALAAAFLEDTWTAVRGLDWVHPVLVTTEATAELQALAGDLPLWLQGPGDLGERLERVLRRALVQGPAVIALGADSPGLPLALLNGVREALACHDAVLGPAEDGGFYALGMRRCPEGALSSLPWSAPNTLDATAMRLRELGLSVGLAQPWFDVDRPEDLLRLNDLLSRGFIAAPATVRVLRAFRLP